MAIKGAAVTITYYALDADNKRGKTGDAGNHTLRGVSDGAEFTLDTSASEVDSTNMPGTYKVTVSASLNDGTMMTVGGKSGTACVVIISKDWMNDIDVNSIAASAITASALAASAIHAAAIDADAFTAIEGNVWSASSRTLTQAAATVVSAVMGSKVTTYKDTYWDVTLTGLTSDLTDNADVLIALKKKVEDTDAQAKLLVSRTAGIERLNAASTGFTASDAVLSVESSTSVRLLLSGSSACVAAGEYTYTVKRIAAASSTGERYLASVGGVWDVDYPGVDEVS